MSTSEETMKRYDSLMMIKEEMESKCWELQQKLGGTYNDKKAQLEDMILMGEMAQAAMDAWKLASDIRKF